MEEQEIRNELIQFFKNSLEVNNPTQLMNLVHHFRKVCQENNVDFQDTFLRVREIINEHITNNILMWGTGGGDSGMPWLSVTEFGKRCLKEDNIIPYDPEGYIEEIKKQIPKIDKITLTYLEESVMTYNKRCLLSASVTLGCASESLIYNLINVSTAFFSEEGKERNEYLGRLEKSWGIFQAFGVLKERILKLKKQRQLPDNLVADIDPILDGMFQFIRINRNQSSHPSGKTPSVKVIYSNLQMFLEYVKVIHKLIEFMMKSPCQKK